MVDGSWIMGNESWVKNSSLLKQWGERIMISYERLEVWQNAIAWACKIINLVEKVNCDKKYYCLIEQIESSSTSVAMNIAEGNGRFSKKEFIQFLYISRGSLYETVTILEIFNNLNWITNIELQDLKNVAVIISKQLNKLISTIKYSMTTSLNLNEQRTMNNEP